MTAPAPAHRAAERGLTLPELLVAMTITTVIIGAMAMALTLAFRTTGATADRFVEAHDAELVATYFVPDAQSSTKVGQAIETGCAEQGAGDAIRLVGPTFATGYRLSGAQLVRWSCVGGHRATRVVAHAVEAAVAWSTGGHQVALTLVATSGHTYSLVGTQRTGTVELPPPRSSDVEPQAAIAVQCHELACTFDAGGSTDADGGIEGYQWDFGDGASASTSSAVHTYGLSGNYTVRLTVTDDGGATGTMITTVAVAGNAPPVPAIAVTCTKTACRFDASASSDPDGTVAAYAWTFGDGGTATTAVADHTFAAGGNYTATLTVTDDHGATGVTSKPVAVVANVPPVASFTASCSGRSCTVDAISSADSDGTIASYRWSWGDGGSNTVTTKTAAHTYAASGPRTIVLTVTDDDGSTAATSRTVNPNLAPVASFTVDACNLAVCAVNASASADADGTIVTYAWTWDDGTANGSGTTATHGYAATGSRTVTLAVTDDDGAVATTTRTVNPPVLVIASKSTGLFSSSVTITWNAASLTADTKVDVYRNGSVVASGSTNSGSFTRTNSTRSQVEGSYRVCDHSVPSRCTNTVAVTLP